MKRSTSVNIDFFKFHIVIVTDCSFRLNIGQAKKYISSF